MNDDTPDRTIGGLPKRGKAPDLSGMLARNRTTVTPPAEAVDKEPAKTQKTITPETHAAKKSATKKRPDHKASGSASTDKTQVTAYMSNETRNRARAAFRATAHIERDRNWSAFIEEAVLAETQRREQKYNDGQPYAGGEEALSPGRGIS